MQTMNYEPGLRAHNTARRPSTTLPPRLPKTPTATELGLKAQIDRLEERNEELATALSDALKDLHLQLATAKDLDPNTNNAVKQVLQRAESVEVCLRNPSLPLPLFVPVATPAGGAGETDESTPSPHPPPKDSEPTKVPTDATASPQQDTADSHVENPQPNAKGASSKPVSTIGLTKTDGPAEARRDAQRPNIRPSLSDAGFSWMLDSSRNLSSFVSSASVPPEQTRHQEAPRTKGSPLFGNSGDEKPGSDAEHDELAMRSLPGGRGPL